MTDHFVSVKFTNYKAFKKFTVGISAFNILVGPNNAGKSTVVGAFRLLSEGLKKARRYNPTYIDTIVHRGFGYRIDLADVPISTENVFTDYDDSQVATIEFELSSGAKLRIVFPESDSCFLIPDAVTAIRNRTDFLRAYDVKLSFVPVLGPVDHNEQLYLSEAARRALQTYGASRNFRNIWHHFAENFSDFQTLIAQTWGGMNIRPPEMHMVDGVPRLHMFCDESRVPREIFWAGFGFQVWCQMLTFIVKSEPNSMLVIDEPDIYLHSDLQRQLVHILKSRQGDVLIATHSTEIIAQADPGDLVILDRATKHARRPTSSASLRSVFSSLGSSLSPLLTQVGKTRRVLFVEGDDFGVIAGFARRLGANTIANQASFAVVKAGGFRPARIKDFSDGMEAMLGTGILRGVVFDRDYRIGGALEFLQRDLEKSAHLVRIHEMKEIENFLLVPNALERALKSRLEDRRKRGGKLAHYEEDLQIILDSVCEGFKSNVFSQCIARHQDEMRAVERSLDQATVNRQALEYLEMKWSTLDGRLSLVPGKDALATLNAKLQEKYSVSLTSSIIISSMHQSEIPEGMRSLIGSISDFAAMQPTESSEKQAAE